MATCYRCKKKIAPHPTDTTIHSGYSSPKATALWEEEALAAGDGDADVYEDIPNYTVYVHFTNLVGIPDNLPLLEAGVRRAVPAHLSVIYLFGNETWNGWDAHQYTWDQVDLLGGIIGLQWNQKDVWN